jgi:hypothetical protein
MKTNNLQILLERFAKDLEEVKNNLKSDESLTQLSTMESRLGSYESEVGQIYQRIGTVNKNQEVLHEKFSKLEKEVGGHLAHSKILLEKLQIEKENAPVSFWTTLKPMLTQWSVWLFLLCMTLLFAFAMFSANYLGHTKPVVEKERIYSYREAWLSRTYEGWPGFSAKYLEKRDSIDQVTDLLRAKALKERRLREAIEQKERELKELKQGL